MSSQRNGGACSITRVKLTTSLAAVSPAIAAMAVTLALRGKAAAAAPPGAAPPRGAEPADPGGPGSGPGKGAPAGGGHPARDRGDRRGGRGGRRPLEQGHRLTTMVGPGPGLAAAGRVLVQRGIGSPRGDRSQAAGQQRPAGPEQAAAHPPLLTLAGDLVGVGVGVRVGAGLGAALDRTPYGAGWCPG